MEQVTVQILERDYRLSCEPAEKAALLAAVAHVDAQMRTIKQQGKVSTPERIAVFAALNIASRLLADEGRAPAPSSPDDNRDAASEPPSNPGATAVVDPEIMRRMQAIDGLLDRALATQDPLF